MASKKVEAQVEAQEEIKQSKMSKADAEAIVAKYDGINGSNLPDELKQARQVLKG